MFTAHHARFTARRASHSAWPAPATCWRCSAASAVATALARTSAPRSCSGLPAESSPAARWRLVPHCCAVATLRVLRGALPLASSRQACAATSWIITPLTQTACPAPAAGDVAECSEVQPRDLRTRLGGAALPRARHADAAAVHGAVPPQPRRRAGGCAGGADSPGCRWHALQPDVSPDARCSMVIKSGCSVVRSRIVCFTRAARCINCACW
jgi:hypothetical protein